MIATTEQFEAELAKHGAAGYEEARAYPPEEVGSTYKVCLFVSMPDGQTIGNAYDCTAEKAQRLFEFAAKGIAMAIKEHAPRQ